MTTPLVLAEAVRAFAPAGVKKFNGEVPPGERVSLAAPWMVLRVSLPGVDERSESSLPSSFRCRLQVTVAGTSEDSVLVVGGQALEAFEGKRPVASGWLCGPLLLVGSPNVYVDDVVSTQHNRRIHVGVMSFESTVSRIPVRL